MFTRTRARRYRTIFEIVPMPWDWPAEVNYHEAKAFCRWKGALDHTAYRLPTEAEWHVMRGVTAISDPNDDPVMHLRSDPKPAANINLRYGSPSAVDEFAPSPAGFHDTLGNVWEYVEDHFAPLPGFEIHDLYDDFSTPCFDGWHTMIVGGSFISTGDEASYFARFHFRRHFFQHLGFRYVVPSAKEQWPGEASVANLWEGKQDVNGALLNSYAGLAASATGFALENNILIVAGALDGASGLILAFLMSKAMNRPLMNVIFGRIEVGTAASDEEVYGGKVRSTTGEEFAMLLGDAQRVVIVPGYGMAVSQAQHAVRDLYLLLEKRGATVEFAIHPVAGRMPGHMNVLLAEADIPYDRMIEMDAINPTFETVDVAVVIGANDVVNPDARAADSPIAGMPILDVDKARMVIVVKRSMSPGFAGIPNPLFANENTLMYFQDAQAGILEVVREVKAL